MNRYSKAFSLLLFCLFATISQASEATTPIEFYLLSSDARHKVNCDFLEIKDKQVLCTENSFLITYDLTNITAIEVKEDGNITHFKEFSEEVRQQINTLNSDKKNPNTGKGEVKGDENGIDSTIGSLDSSVDYAKNFIANLSLRDDTGLLTTSLVFFGLFVTCVGNILLLIAAFRAGILWGLGCLLLPVVSFVFLFVHWKTAAKPFLLVLLGCGIMFLSVFFTTPRHASARVHSSQTFSSVSHKDGRFQCRGKTRCSEMSSCAEARFYLHNCPGTKMDGDNNGIPCERQWCGH